MNKDRLQQLFKPESLALFGASTTPGSLGTVVLENLRSAEYQGRVTLINPKHEELDGEPCHPSLSYSGQRAEAAVIVAPAEALPDIIDDCGESGVGAAIVISAGFREAGGQGAALESEMLRRARRYGLRLLGPNCLGVIRTDIGLNATFSAGNAIPGRIAVVSQSGALCTAILDWAEVNGVGFSSVISTGIAADVGFGEILDFVTMDPNTDSIMLYLEGLHESRHFMSALRAAARTKPVVVMKAGRHAQGSRAAESHTGAIVGSDEVFDSALRRAGALRVADFPEFFAAAATLDSGVRTAGGRLAIVTNAGGPGVLAADHCADLGMELATLGDDTMQALDGVLPAAWSHGNPVDILGDAEPERYRAAIEVCLEDPGLDALLVILAPQALTAPLEVARQIVALRDNSSKPMLVCWMGDVSVAESRELFQQENLPSYRTPEAAVRAFAAIAAYRENQQQLLQVPDPLIREDASSPANASLIIENALAEGRRVLSQAEGKAVLAAFHVPIMRSMPADSAQEAILVAQETGFPVAMKIDSPDITHKTEVGGVRLGLSSGQEVRNVFKELTESVATQRPEAEILGVVIEPMWQGRDTRELMVGVLRDEIFGPVISFGLGGTLVEVLRDRAVSLPPLNRFLAAKLVGHTRAAEILGPFRGAPAVDRKAIEILLLRVSEMACELPSIVEMDLNPVMANADGVAVVDARIVVAPHNEAARPYEHMAIHPYPRNLVQHCELSEGTAVVIRPIRPEDAVIEREFVDNLSQQSRYFRFMYSLSKITPQMVSRFTQIDYDREMALIAVIEENGKEREIGVTRYAMLPDQVSCEFAIVVADDWQNKGLARRLLSALIDAARYRQYRYMNGVVLKENQRMLDFVKALGFKVEPSSDDPDLVEVTLEL
ncbi:MAG: bifunctional acetate--CoA ligase family protein/GNAT family N-acetyltransferase [Xanthomonadales bacterium]|nr:bifunctional acetate--CoA ligase family protein/GNAT family N-acetyltransferase [Xanthomonadales bacterium]